MNVEYVTKTVGLFVAQTLLSKVCGPKSWVAVKQVLKPQTRKGAGLRYRDDSEILQELDKQKRVLDKI